MDVPHSTLIADWSDTDLVLCSPPIIIGEVFLPISILSILPSHSASCIETCIQSQTRCTCKRHATHWYQHMSIIDRSMGSRLLSMAQIYVYRATKYSSRASLRIAPIRSWHICTQNFWARASSIDLLRFWPHRSLWAAVINVWQRSVFPEICHRRQTWTDSMHEFCHGRSRGLACAGISMPNQCQLAVRPDQTWWSEVIDDPWLRWV